MAAGSGQRDHGHVGGRRDRPGLQPDGADVELRLAVQTDDRRHAGEAAVGDHVERSAGHTFLGGLEDEPHRSGKLVSMMGEVQGGSEHDGRVDVMAARVRHAWHLAAVGDVLLVGHGECVEVGPKCESVHESGGANRSGTMSHTRPVPTPRRRGSSPASWRRSSTRSVVARSSPLSSGCAWRLRRSATRPSPCSSSHRSIGRGTAVPDAAVTAVIGAAGRR